MLRKATGTATHAVMGELDPGLLAPGCVQRASRAEFQERVQKTKMEMLLIKETAASDERLRAARPGE